MGKINYDRIWLGTLSGVFIPLMFFILVYFVREPEMKLGNFISRLYNLKALPKLVSLCLLPNLILFFAFLRKDFLYASRGVILSLFIYAVIILVLKFA